MKRKNTLTTLLLLIFVYTLSFAQEKSLISLTIPPNLIENANAVVRNNSIEISIEDVDKMIVTKKVVVTVLNKLGRSDARIGESYNEDTKITKLNAFIYDAFGKQIKKYKEKDFLDVSAVDGGTLYSDARVKYIDYKPISYPYTLVFESTYKTSTTGFIPWWFPVNGYFVSVEKSSYTIYNPKAIPWRIKETNFKDFSIVKNESPTSLEYVLKNQKAFEYENSTISSREFLPKALLALNKSYLKGVYGEYTNWKEFGTWMNNKLLAGRNEVDEATKTKVLALVAGVENPIEKAKIVYKFMQNKTRYISVQVGIGGWEPIAANVVDEVGYGDCKGLTNYTKALLDVVGVTSYYTVVYASEKRSIDKDFSSIQGNHVILNLPNNGKDIWLECTSQTMPFGFLGDFTDDRDVLVVTPEGGVIKRTASYKNETNLQVLKAKVSITEEGNVLANLQRTSKGIQYDDKYFIESFTKDELVKYYKSRTWNYINNLEIISANLENNKDSIFFKEDLEMNIRNYASINTNELLFRVNIFNRESYVPKRYRTRNLPLKISRGYKDVDKYTITIPENYKIEYLPEAREIKSKFGIYKITFQKIDESTLSYHKSILIKEGLYPKEDYKSYRSFRRKIAKSDNLRIAIIKK